jgi:GTP-binding protein EngB required for normal cell division
VADDTRLRLSYPESTVVVALVGGTGSGKSSLLNAIAEEEVALTGGIRPMTVAPLALVPTSERASLDGYLDILGISERVDHAGPEWLCLIDLPDNDSVEVEHRHQVAQLLPRVDMIIWVTDPEKYRDASLHQGSIAPLSAYQRQFAFVLNQVDRIVAQDVHAVVDDFAEALRDDGITEPYILTTAAQPAAGPPIGIDSLLQHLERGRSHRESVHRKLLTDLGVAASLLVASSSGAHGVDFEKRWAHELEKAANLGLAGEVSDAAHGLAGFVARLAEEVDGETTDRLHEVSEDVPSLFLACMSEVESPATAQNEQRWFWRARVHRQGSTAVDANAAQGLQSAVDLAVGNPIRDLLAARGRAHAAIADLALAVGDLERRST